MATTLSITRRHVNDSFCENCHKNEETDKKLSVCARCCVTKYCNSACQKKDWSGHRQICISPPDEGRVKAVWDSIMVYSAKDKTEVVVLGEKFANAAAWWAHQTVEKTSYWSVLEENFPQVVKGKMALDLGCGKGLNSIFLISMGWKVTAIDSSEAIIERFQNILHESSKLEGCKEAVERLDLKLQDVHEFAFTEKYDLIVASDVFPYLDPTKIQEILRNAYNSLTINGCLLGTFFFSFEGEEMQKPIRMWVLKESKVDEARIILRSLGEGAKIEFCDAASEMYRITFILRKTS